MCIINDCLPFCLTTGSRMRSSNFGFKEQDVANIDLIIEAINELVSSKCIDITWLVAPWFCCKWFLEASVATFKIFLIRFFTFRKTRGLLLMTSWKQRVLNVVFFVMSYNIYLTGTKERFMVRIRFVYFMAERTSCR